MPPEALILAIDTSAAHCAAALLWGSRGSDPAKVLRIVTCAEPMAKGQAERLVPMIDALLAAQGVAWSDLTLLAVGIGPGNFTGIRIAVSLGRGLALSLGIPAVGVTGFEATAAHAGPPDCPIWTVIDAPRAQAYVQRFPADRAGAAVIEAAQLAGLDAPILRLADLTADQMVTAIATFSLHKGLSPQPRPAPFYLRSADAAPSPDPPPVILP